MSALATCAALVTLALALPALANPIGEQSRISQMGPDGNASFDAFDPHVAYNPTTNQSFVVWEGDNLGTGEDEIHGRMVDAAGHAIGLQMTLSDMGPPGNAAFDAEDPAVVYNSQANEFLVVWNGDDVTDEEYEIFGQRVNAGGAQVGTNDLRISQMGVDGDAGFDAFDPQVAYNPRRNQYMVVWEGEDGPPAFAAGEREIFGQRVNAAGAQIGTNDFRISDMGTNGDAARDAFDPYIAYNSITNEYLAVWEGDDGTPPLAAAEREIFGQLVNAAGAEAEVSGRADRTTGQPGNRAAAPCAAA